MEHRLTPEFFCGSAIAALIGLLSGLLLHAAWQKNPGGPQILFSSAAAAEAAGPDRDGLSPDRPAPVELADQDTGPAPPNPLPVTRLAPQMFDVQPAAEDEQREDVDDVVADVAPQAPPRDFD